MTATQSANTAAQLLLGAAGILGVQTVGSAAVDFVQQKGEREMRKQNRGATHWENWVLALAIVIAVAAWAGMTYASH